jgi:Ca2+-binding EF-hand superfamily protein
MSWNAVAVWGCALALLAPLPSMAQDGQDGQPGMGEARSGFEHLTEGEPRRRPGEAVRRDRFDEVVAEMFASADSDRNGTLTLAELRATIEARKVAAIRGRFASVDLDRNQSVSFTEFDQWQRGLGSAALSDEAAASASIAAVSEDIGPEPGRGPGARVISRLVVPLNATMLVSANTDYDAGASLAEITAFEGRRFGAADANGDGWVTEDELRDAAPGG